MVSEILRKMVRKYSRKRSDVIAVATKNATVGFTEHLEAKSSGNMVTSHLSRSPAQSLEGLTKHTQTTLRWRMKVLEPTISYELLSLKLWLLSICPWNYGVWSARNVKGIYNLC
jgi:hypothetical protein